MVLASVGLWAKIHPQSTSGGCTELSSWLSPSAPPPLPSPPVPALSGLADGRTKSCEGGEEQQGTCSRKTGGFHIANSYYVYLLFLNLTVGEAWRQV